MFSSEFFITSMVVVLIPGTGVIYMVSTGLFHGWKSSIAAALGCTTGIIPHLSASILGLSVILHMSALAFQCIKYAGAIYLLYLAWSMWQDTGKVQFQNSSGAPSFRKVAARGFAINILNPKLSLFFLAYLPLFVSPDSGSPLVEMLILSVIFMGMTLLIFILYGLLAHGVRRHIFLSPRIMSRLQRSFALIFAALGVKLAMTDR